MDRREIRATALEVVVAQLDVVQDEVVDGASFTDDLGADELHCVELCMAIEEQFGISIPDEEAEEIFENGTFRGLLDYLEEHVYHLATHRNIWPIGRVPRSLSA